MPQCSNCGKEIDPDSFFCPYCGETTKRPVVPERPVRPPHYPYPPPRMAYGPERVNMGDVLSTSWRVIAQRPIIILPHVISIIVGTLVGGAAITTFLFYLFGLTPEEYTPLALGWLIVGFIVTIVVHTTIGGMYPDLTKHILEGEEVDLGGVASKALGRFFSLLGAAILVALITFAGIIPLIIGIILLILTLEVPIMGLVGLVFLILGIVLVLYILCWYYCVIPALMLEDRGILDALSTSKEFSKGRKWAIFGLILIVAIISLILSLIAGIFPGHIGTALGYLVSLIITVYESVIPSYLYIRYKGLLVTPPPSAPVYPAPVTPIPETKQICPTCGSEIEPGQVYCGWCGSKLP
ncbi:MAG: hypothetical protein ACE5R6_11855 [Candidatus Heimdallarchaeota archaeon]